MKRIEKSLIVPMKEVDSWDLKGTYNPISIFPEINTFGPKLWSKFIEENINIEGGEVRFYFDQPNLKKLLSHRKKGYAPLDIIFMPKQKISILGYTLTGDVEIDIRQWDDNHLRSPEIIYGNKINLGVEAKVAYEGCEKCIEREGEPLVERTLEVLEKYLKEYNEI